MPRDSPALGCRQLGCRQLGCPRVILADERAWTLPPPAAAAPPIRNKTSMVSLRASASRMLRLRYDSRLGLTHDGCVA